jgi:hypothetical protein
VPGRRALLAVAILLLTAALVTSVSPRQRERTSSISMPQAEPAGAAERRTVEGRLPADRVVRAREGDIVELEVTSRAPDEARVVALGLEGPTEPGLPAKLTFVADRAGRFAVTLRDAGTRAGKLEIAER